MNRATDWKQVWENKSGADVSDAQFDRGVAPRDADLDELSRRELLAFVGPRREEVVLDAGCGTGTNIRLLRGRVGAIFAFDYAGAAVARCHKRLRQEGINDVALMQASVTSIPLKDKSVDRVLCMSVLQYLNDEDVRAVLSEFGRVLRGHGQLVMHVKNLSSIYLSTLVLAKRAKRLLGRPVAMEYFRPFKWYISELRAAGFTVVDYNSFNVLMVDGMPRGWLNAIQRLELKHYQSPIIRRTMLRRSGSELKIKAVVGSATKGE